MPNKYQSNAAKLESLVMKFCKTIFSTDGKTLILQILLNDYVNGIRKSTIKQHLLTSGHKRRAANARAHQQQLGEVMQSNVFVEEYNRELAEAFLSADIPPNKLNNKKLSSVIFKYTHITTPSPSTLRRFTPMIYNDVLTEIRKQIGDSAIYVEVNETMDAEGRIISV
jgi:hypothetical protein